MSKLSQYNGKEWVEIKGRKGDSYTLTPEDKSEIAESIDVPVVEKVTVTEVAVPDTAEDIVNKLELLTEDDRLDVSAIKGIEDMLKEVNDKIGNLGGRIQTPKRVHTPQLQNFQASTDGSNKAFTLKKAPNDASTIKAWGSDFPHIMTDGFGFTVAGSVVTLDSDVDAPTTNSYFVIEWYS